MEVILAGAEEWFGYKKRNTEVLLFFCLNSISEKLLLHKIIFYSTEANKSCSNETATYFTSFTLVCRIREFSGTLYVSQILPPTTEPFPIVIRPSTEALE